MAVTTFSMDPRSAAPTCAGAAIIPYGGRWSSEWIDVNESVSLLRVEHPDEDTDVVVGRVMAADPGVRLVK